MVNKNVLSCVLKDGREVDTVTLVGRLFHARATVTRNDRSPMMLSRVRGTIRSTQPGDLSVGRRNEYWPKGGDPLTLGVKADMVLFACNTE